jgi:hypothetical protein
MLSTYDLLRPFQDFFDYSDCEKGYAQLRLRESDGNRALIHFAPMPHLYGKWIFKLASDKYTQARLWADTEKKSFRVQGILNGSRFCNWWNKSSLAQMKRLARLSLSFDVEKGTEGLTKFVYLQSSLMETGGEPEKQWVEMYRNGSKFLPDGTSRYILTSAITGYNPEEGAARGFSVELYGWQEVVGKIMAAIMEREEARLDFSIFKRFLYVFRYAPKGKNWSTAFGTNYEIFDDEHRQSYVYLYYIHNMSKAFQWGLNFNFKTAGNVDSAHYLSAKYSPADQSYQAAFKVKHTGEVWLKEKLEVMERTKAVAVQHYAQDGRWNVGLGLEYAI